MSARRDGHALVVMVQDDGRGGADPQRGTGLIGLTDRVEALRGTLSISSSCGAGTLLRAEFPLAREESVPGTSVPGTDLWCLAPIVRFSVRRGAASNPVPGTLVPGTDREV